MKIKKPTYEDIIAFSVALVIMSVIFAPSLYIKDYKNIKVVENVYDYTVLDIETNNYKECIQKVKEKIQEEEDMKKIKEIANEIQKIKDELDKNNRRSHNHRNRRNYYDDYPQMGTQRRISNQQIGSNYEYNY